MGISLHICPDSPSFWLDFPEVRQQFYKLTFGSLTTKASPKSFGWKILPLTRSSSRILWEFHAKSMIPEIEGEGGRRY